MTQSVTRILVPIDFSAPADAALAFAKTIAHTFGASLHLIHVFQEPIVTAAFPDAYSVLPANVRASLLEDARQQLDNRVTDDVRRHYSATADIVSGATTAIAIVEYAQDHQIDVIVTGTHGRTGMSHLFLGSVAERVVLLADRPVLTVRAPAPQEAAA